MDEQIPSAELAELRGEELAALSAIELAKHSVPVELHSSVVGMFLLCSMLQLALRHPHCDQFAAAARTARGFIEAFRKNLGPEFPATKELLALGDNPKFDVPRVEPSGTG